MASALASVDELPASVGISDGLTRLLAGKEPEPADLVALLASDLGLAIGALRLAGSHTPGGREIPSLESAVDRLEPTRLLAMVAATGSFDPLAASDDTEPLILRIRSHAAATRAAAIELCRAGGFEAVEEAATTALIHDVGHLVIRRLHPEHDPGGDRTTRTPQERQRAERERYGIDHALVGGVLARRWDLPDRIAVAIERHHNENATGLAALVAAADQVAHYRAGDAVSIPQLVCLAGENGVGHDELRRILNGTPPVIDPQVVWASEPCPLSEREMDTLVGLGQGRVYKQIAEDLGISVSTIRTHLHNVYRKLEVIDRAQAVIKAREMGWL
ncbi:MAG TPA: HDOD domain-containing protein [Solirubrobacterales bacterium]|nr:HDOD domain-containing protein [Solirubrobacterales bacterium]